MTYVECAGGQDRDTTTSETRPYIPPSETKNCYLSDPNNRSIGFDRSLCGTSGEKACEGPDIEGNQINGSNEACKPDNQGGYCKVDENYYVARRDKFIQLDKDDLLERYKSSSSSGNEVDTKRALRDQERKFTNRIRELQIKGQDPLTKKKSEKRDDKELHGSVSGMLSKIGMWFLVILFFISLSILLVQKKII